MYVCVCVCVCEGAGVFDVTDVRVAENPDNELDIVLRLLVSKSQYSGEIILIFPQLHKPGLGSPFFFTA